MAPDNREPVRFRPAPLAPIDGVDASTMKRIELLLAALSLGAAASAQATPATATVRDGCTVEGPTNSLVPKPDSPLTFLPNGNDLFVMECESIRPLGSWVQEDSLAGFGGCSYLRWNGPDHFNQPGNGVLDFWFEVDTPGDYLLRINVRHDHPDRSLENDCWVRMDAAGPWEKYVNNFQGSVGVWNWDSVFESTMQKPTYTLSAGAHVFQISARSRNFKIDRVHFFPQTTFGTTIAHPESARKHSRPIIGTNFAVEIDDPCDEGGLIPGVTTAQWFATTSAGGNVPCGTVFKGQEILIGLSPAPMKGGPAQVWNGSPITINVPIPNDLGLVGAVIYTQAVFFNPGGFVLSDALDLVIGDM